MDNEMDIIQIIIEDTKENYIPLTIITNRGEIFYRYYKSIKTNSAAIWVGGVGGGFDTPANGLYPQLSKRLLDENISSLRIQYRNPTNLAECIYDVQVGIKFLQNEGISNIALIGHSLGGSVVIQAAALSKNVVTVVALASQSYGADIVHDLGKETSILLIHGKDDSVLPASCTNIIFGKAHEPKERVLISGNGHCLEESAEDVKEIVYNWILRYLKDN
jgi:pimeloyl-ACP methyl ester carboxylesterase